MKKLVSFRKFSRASVALMAWCILSLPAGADIVSQARIDYVTLEGKAVPAANQIEGDLIKTFSAPALLLYRCPVKPASGTILLCPGGGYGVLEMKKEGENTAHLLNQQGFDEALLEYHASSGPATRELALADTLAAFRLIKSQAPALGLHNERLGIMGYSAGGHLAARTVQNLAANEQPDDLILAYPAYLQEAIPGTVIPDVAPPLNPGRLFILISSNDNADWVKGSQEYAKTWIGFGGVTASQLLPDGGHGFGMGADSTASIQHWPDLLNTSERGFLIPLLDLTACSISASAGIGPRTSFGGWTTGNSTVFIRGWWWFTLAPITPAPPTMPARTPPPRLWRG